MRLNTSTGKYEVTKSLTSYNVGQLQTLCRKLKIPLEGTKPELISRLADHYPDKMPTKVDIPTSLENFNAGNYGFADLQKIAAALELKLKRGTKKTKKNLNSLIVNHFQEKGSATATGTDDSGAVGVPTTTDATTTDTTYDKDSATTDTSTTTASNTATPAVPPTTDATSTDDSGTVSVPTTTTATTDTAASATATSTDDFGTADVPPTPTATTDTAASKTATVPPTTTATDTAASNTAARAVPPTTTGALTLAPALPAGLVALAAGSDPSLQGAAVTAAPLALPPLSLPTRAAAQDDFEEEARKRKRVNFSSDSDHDSDTDDDYETGKILPALDFQRTFNWCPKIIKFVVCCPFTECPERVVAGGRKLCTLRAQELEKYVKLRHKRLRRANGIGLTNLDELVPTAPASMIPVRKGAGLSTQIARRLDGSGTTFMFVPGEHDGWLDLKLAKGTDYREQMRSHYRSHHPGENYPPGCSVKLAPSFSENWPRLDALGKTFNGKKIKKTEFQNNLKKICRRSEVRTLFGKPMSSKELADLYDRMYSTYCNRVARLEPKSGPAANQREEL